MAHVATIRMTHRTVFRQPCRFQHAW